MSASLQCRFSPHTTTLRVYQQAPVSLRRCSCRQAPARGSATLHAEDVGWGGAGVGDAFLGKRLGDVARAAGHADLESRAAFEPLFDSSPHVIISENDGLAAKPMLSLKELVDKPMVLLDLPATQDYFLSYFHAHGLRPNVQYRLKNFEMVRGLVGPGVGFSFGFLPLPMTRTYQGNVLVRRPIEESVPSPRVCLAYPKNVLATRSLEAFMEAARVILNAKLLKRYERKRPR